MLQPTSRRGVWLATSLIVLVGVLVLVWSLSPGERRQRELAERLVPGDAAERVVQLLGPPVRCPRGTLGHLRDSFVAGLPPAAQEAALERLRRETRERWLYPLERRPASDCTPREGSTEVGIDARQRVLWYVASTGKTVLQLPEGYAGGAATP